MSALDRAVANPLGRCAIATTALAANVLSDRFYQLAYRLERHSDQLRDTAHTLLATLERNTA